MQLSRNYLSIKFGAIDGTTNGSVDKTVAIGYRTMKIFRRHSG